MCCQELGWRDDADEGDLRSVVGRWRLVGDGQARGKKGREGGKNVG